MSRIGRAPVAIPDKVEVKIDGGRLSAKGSVGALELDIHPLIEAAVVDDGKAIEVKRKDETRSARALHGLTRALIQNMVVGVSQGYEKRLEIVGVGYLAAVQGNKLQLRVGFANEIHLTIPEGLNVTCPDQTHVSVKGADKQKVGQFAAEVRAARKPEPYKGKGVRYEGEQIRRKAGKALAK